MPGMTGKLEMGGETIGGTEEVEVLGLFGLGAKIRCDGGGGWVNVVLGGVGGGGGIHSPTARALTGGRQEWVPVIPLWCLLAPNVLREIHQRSSFALDMIPPSRHSQFIPNGYPHWYSLFDVEGD